MMHIKRDYMKFILILFFAHTAYLSSYAENNNYNHLIAITSQKAILVERIIFRSIVDESLDAKIESPSHNTSIEEQGMLSSTKEPDQ